MQEQEPVAVALPPVRPRNEKPRRVKAAPQSTEDKPAAPEMCIRDSTQPYNS